MSQFLAYFQTAARAPGQDAGVKPDECGAETIARPTAPRRAFQRSRINEVLLVGGMTRMPKAGRHDKRLGGSRTQASWFNLGFLDLFSVCLVSQLWLPFTTLRFSLRVRLGKGALFSLPAGHRIGEVDLWLVPWIVPSHLQAQSAQSKSQAFSHVLLGPFAWNQMGSTGSHSLRPWTSIYIFGKPIFVEKNNKGWLFLFWPIHWTGSESNALDGFCSRLFLVGVFRLVVWFCSWCLG